MFDTELEYNIIFKTHMDFQKDSLQEPNLKLGIYV